MSVWLLACVLAYFALLLGVAAWTSRHADSQAFFIGSRQSPWPLVAFGMVGTSLSGVTFVSVPGAVALNQFSYLQVVLGQFLGYFVIAFVLLPLYYRRGLTSIYGFLGQRLGPSAYRTGAAFFIVSRTLGATARLYLVARVLNDMILGPMGLPFWLTAAAIVLMIVLYTVEGGVRTIVYTDTLQTAGMLTGLAVCTALLLRQLDLGVWDSLQALHARGLDSVFVTQSAAAGYWAKQLLAGFFIAIAMTGMDQEMMQKSLSVPRLADSQKNMMVLAFVLLAVVGAFLYLGGLLALYAPTVGLQAAGDRLFPAVVLGHLPPWVQLLFVMALISALFPSADGALTALTSSFCIDLLGLGGRSGGAAGERRLQRIRRTVHGSFALLFLALVLGFKALDDPSMIGLILKIAAYTYGPLLGLFAFGLYSRRSVRGPAVPLVAVAAPLVCALVDAQQRRLFGSWQIGLELLVANALLTMAGLWLISRQAEAAARA